MSFSIKCFKSFKSFSNFSNFSFSIFNIYQRFFLSERLEQNCNIFAYTSTDLGSCFGKNEGFR